MREAIGGHQRSSESLRGAIWRRCNLAEVQSGGGAIWRTCNLADVQSDGGARTERRRRLASVQATRSLGCTCAREMPRAQGDCRGSSLQSNHRRPQRWSADACRLVAGRRRRHPRAHRGPDEGGHHAQSDRSSCAIRGLIRRNQRSHHAQSEVSSGAIRGRIRRNQRSHQPQSEGSSGTPSRRRHPVPAW